MQQNPSIPIFVLTFLLLTMSRTMAAPPSLTLTTVDGNGQPLFAEQLEWWYDDNSAAKTVLNCTPNTCDTWDFPALAISNTAISIVALVRLPEDPTCANWYTGELAAQKQKLTAGHFKVQLKHTETACK